MRSVSRRARTGLEKTAGASPANRHAEPAIPRSRRRDAPVVNFLAKTALFPRIRQIGPAKKSRLGRLQIRAVSRSPCVYHNWNRIKLSKTTAARPGPRRKAAACVSRACVCLP
jgi:hypothetical protein